MLMHQKSMFDRYCCIQTFVARKLSRNCFEKVIFSCTYNGAEKHFTSKRFENAASRAKINHPDSTKFLSLMCTFLIISVFVTAPECLFVKPQSRALTACELPC